MSSKRSSQAEGSIQPALGPSKINCFDLGCNCASHAAICPQVGDHKAFERQARKCHGKPPEGIISTRLKIELEHA